MNKIAKLFKNTTAKILGYIDDNKESWINDYLTQNLLDQEQEMVYSENLLGVPSDLSAKRNGITVTSEADRIIVNGTWTAAYQGTIVLSTITLPAGKYNLSIWDVENKSDDSLIGVGLYEGSSYRTGFVFSARDNISFNISEEITLNFSLMCKADLTTDNASFKVMIKEGTSEPESYIDYFEPRVKVKNYIKEEYIQKQVDDINSLKEIVGMSESPLSGLSENGGYVRAFEKIACIGDSLTAGNLNYNGDSSGEYVNDFTSYPKNLERMLGNTVYKLAVGGATAINSDQSIADNHSWLKNADEKKWLDNIANAYVIALGVNDIGTYGSFSGDVTTDIDTSNYSNNALTSVGGYATIIQRILELQPKAKIFCVTIPNTRTTTKKRKEANEKIKAIAELFGCYLIDLETYGVSSTEAADWKLKYYNGGHLNGLGYVELAKMILTYMNWIIKNNISDFKEIAFIGTDYSYTT